MQRSQLRRPLIGDPQCGPEAVWQADEIPAFTQERRVEVMRVAAWALIARGSQDPRSEAWDIDSVVLVQCDENENFYRLPGGSIENGETAASACARELHEEYGLRVSVGSLAAVYENVGFNEVILIHRCQIQGDTGDYELAHHEVHGVRLVWKSIADLCGRHTSPRELAAILKHTVGGPIHLINESFRDTA